MEVGESLGEVRGVVAVSPSRKGELLIEEEGDDGIEDNLPCGTGVVRASSTLGVKKGEVVSTGIASSGNGAGVVRPTYTWDDEA